MNTECLDTLRQLLMHMKENTDSESSCEEAQTSEEAGRLPSFRSSSSSSEAEVPLEAIPLALRSSNHLEVAAVAALRHQNFKCDSVPTIAEQQIVEIPSQRNFNAALRVNKDLLESICEFLDSRDLLILRNVCQEFRKIALTVLLRRSLSEQTFEAIEWELLINYQYVCGRQPDTFRLNSEFNIQEQSEHSRDLDRTFLTEETEQVEGQAKLDRVLRALSSNFEYFQGLNYISAAFLARYPEDFSYWCVRYLMRRVNYFPTQLHLFRGHIETLDSIVERQLPTVYNHLRYNDVDLEYFATRWLLTLYSYDTEVDLMLRLWRLVCLTDVSMILCFTLVMLRKIESKILECDEEGLNQLLKFELKQIVDRLDRQFLLEESVKIYLENFLEQQPILDSMYLEMDEDVVHYRTTAAPIASEPPF